MKQFFHCVSAAASTAASVRWLLGCYVLCGVGINAYADTSKCYQWRYEQGSQGYFYDSGWQVEPMVVCSDYAQHCRTPTISTGCPVTNTVNYRIDDTAPLLESPTPTFPAGYNCRVTVHYTCLSGGCAGQSLVTTGGPKGLSYREAPAECKVYVSASPPQRGPSCNSVGDPIDPATCAMHAAERDVDSGATSIRFERFHDSASRNGATSKLWRHTFSRSIKPIYSSSTYRAYSPGADASALYSTEAAACVSGFADIKNRVSNWENATASYSDGVCSLNVGTTNIGRLSLLYTSIPTPAPGAAMLIGFDAIRDDGQVISFAKNGASIAAAANANLKLQQVGSGFSLTDSNDTVETYGSNGELLSVASRAGEVRTMSYDSSGRLAMVIDNHGRQLTLAYDEAGRLISVTK